MTGIFQIFDRYKAKAYRKNDPRKAKNGEPETSPVSAYFKEDGVAKDVSPEIAGQRQAQSEASRDSRRSSSADTNELVVKSLTSAKASQPDIVQKPHAARVSTDSREPRLSSYSQDESRSPHGSQKGCKESKQNPHIILAKAETPKSAASSRDFVEGRSATKDILKLPPRDTRGVAKVSAPKDKSRTSVENVKDASAPFNDATDISRALMQLKEATQLPLDMKDDHRRSSVAARKDGQRYQLSGDEREADRYQKEGRRYQSSGDEKEGHRYLAGENGNDRRYSSATEYHQHQVYDDEKDDCRPYYSSENKGIRHSLKSSEGRRNQALGYVMVAHRYQSTGDETDGQRYPSSGDEKGGHRFHLSSEGRGGRRNRTSVYREGHKTYAFADRDGEMHQSPGDGKDGTRYESSGGERGPHRPYPSAGRREVQRQYYHSSGDEMEGRRYHLSAERGEGRRHQSSTAGKDGPNFQISGDERGGSRHQDGHRKQSSADYGGLKHQSSAELNERHKYQFSGDERGNYRYQSSGDERGDYRYQSSSKGFRHQSSPSEFDGRRSQWSGDEQGGHRFYLSADDREGGKRHDTNHRRRDKPCDEDMEGFTHLRTNVRDDGRRNSSATEAPRSYSVNMEKGRRYQASGDGRDDGNHSSVREGHRYEAVSDPKAVHRHYLNVDVNNGRKDGVFDNANNGFEIETVPAVKEGHRRNLSAEFKGGHRRQSSTLPKETLRPHLPVDARISQSRDMEPTSGHSKDLPPRSSGSRSTVSPRNLVDIRDLARLTALMREGSQSSAPKESNRGEPQKPIIGQETGRLSVESNASSKLHHDFRETLRAIDFRDSQWNFEKGRDGSRTSFDGRDPPRTSSVSRLSVDSRQQSSTPRLSVEGREHLRASSLHSSRASSVDAHAQLRINSMDSNGSGEYKTRGPSVVARLMGLAELPDSDTCLPSSDRPAVREGKSLQKLLNTTPPGESVSPASDRAKLQLHLSEVALQVKQVAARLQQDSQLRQNSQLQQDSQPKRKSKAKARSNSPSRSPPPAPAQQDGDTRAQTQHQGAANLGPQVETGNLHPQTKQPMSPKHHQMEGMPNAFKRRPEELPPGDVDQRLHQLRIKNSIQEHKTLKQILEAMHLKGLLHPPKRSNAKSVKAQTHERGSSMEEAQRPLQDAGQKLPPSSSNVTSSRCTDNHDIFKFHDSLRKVTKVQEEPTPAVDHTGEASIVVMKPLNHQSVSPPAAPKEVENQLNQSPPRSSNLAATTLSGSESIRGRSSERRAMTSGKVSRSHSQEPPEQSTVEKAPTDELNFANVMLSWRERIAAEAAKRAAIELTEAKLQPHPKGPPVNPPGPRQRSRDSSPSRSGSGSKTASGQTVEKSRNQEKQEAASLKDREEPEAAVGTMQSGILQGRASSNEDQSKAVGRGISDRHIVTPSPETMAVLEPSFGRTPSDRVPAQVAVLRSKRTTGKTGRPKDKLRTSPPGDMQTRPNVEGDASIDQYFMGSSHELRKRDTATESRPQVETTAFAIADTRSITPKKRKIEEPALVNEEEHQRPFVTTPEIEMQDLSEGEVNYGSAGDSPDAAATSVAASPAGFSGVEQSDAEVDVAVEDASGHNPREITLPKHQCIQEESGFIVQGADHPSPVSVLDSPIFQEGFRLEELSPSPKSVKSSTIRHEGAEGLENFDGAVCEPEAELPTPPLFEATKDVTDPLKDIYTKVARSLELSDKKLYSGHSGAELPVPFIHDAKTTPEHELDLSFQNQDEERVYVRDILIESGLADEASTLSDECPEIMQFDVFTRKEEELQTAELNRIDMGELDKSEEQRYKESLDRRLIFDCMNEILGRKMSPFLNPQPWGTPVIRKKPSGQLLVDEVWAELQDMHWPVTDAYDGLYALLQKDFMRKGFQWVGFSIEVGEVGCHLERMIFQDMVEEAVQDVMSIKPVRKSSPPPTPPAPPTPPSSPARAPAPPSDDSESRRRELLEKTRRDLLAWHVQYQQL